MANILFALDRNKTRRNNFISGLLQNISPVEELEVKSVDATDWSLVWSVSKKASVSVASDDQGVSVVWGDAIDDSGKRQDAFSLRNEWAQKPESVWDGYYAALVADSQGEVLVGVDLLGIFPIFYWHGEDVLLLSTSPELIASHPSFKTELDMRGFVGILLANGLVGGSTLLKNVRRLTPGHQLRFSRGKVTEVQTYQVPPPLAFVDMTFTAHVDMLHEVISNSVKRHAPPELDYGVLLSGGLDSRMMAGYLVHQGCKVNALTSGVPSDLDARCAAAVANVLGISHKIEEPSASGYRDYANSHAKWEHLSNGFITIRDWWIQGRIGQLGDRLVTGMLADAVIGGTAIDWAYSSSPPRMSYEAYVENMPRHGFTADALCKLLKPEYHDLIHEMQQFLQDEFYSYSDVTAYNAWRYDLAHKERHHVGATPWRLSFGNWPVLPTLDREVLRVAAGIPAASLAYREAQLALVKKRFPELGPVPLDRSDIMSDIPQYINPRLRHMVTNNVKFKIKRLQHKLKIPVMSKETRYWYRVNNLNGELWNEVRASSDKFRDYISYAFNQEEFDLLLPGSGKQMDFKDPGATESARKLLLGYLIWAQQHL